MKQITKKILEILEEHAWAESSLSSQEAREKITEDILKVIDNEPRDISKESV